MRKDTQSQRLSIRFAVTAPSTGLIIATVLACLDAAGYPGTAAGQASASAQAGGSGAGLASAVGVVRQKLAGDPAQPATPASPSPTTARVVARTQTTGLRDPFKLPPPPAPALAPGEWRPPANRPPGKQGLVIDELRVEGIVRQDSSRAMTAVVTNETNRAYFLREGDSVYDGVVTRITPEAVYFHETMLGRNGGSRDVVKALRSGAGGQR